MKDIAANKSPIIIDDDGIAEFVQDALTEKGVKPLTKKEMNVFMLDLYGGTMESIARDLDINLSKVSDRRSSTKKKLSSAFGKEKLLTENMLGFLVSKMKEQGDKRYILGASPEREEAVLPDIITHPEKYEDCARIYPDKVEQISDEEIEQALKKHIPFKIDYDSVLEYLQEKLRVIGVELKEIETEVLCLCFEKYTSKEMAEQLHFNYRSIEGYRSEIISKVSLAFNGADVCTKNMLGFLIDQMQKEEDYRYIDDTPEVSNGYHEAIIAGELPITTTHPQAIENYDGTVVESTIAEKKQPATVR